MEQLRRFYTVMLQLVGGVAKRFCSTDSIEKFSKGYLDQSVCYAASYE